MKKSYVFTSLLAIVAVALVARSYAEDQKAAGVAIGAKAPDFTLQDQTGKPVSLHDFTGKVVVLEWTNPKCPVVQGLYAKKTMQTLFNEYHEKNVAWLAVNSSYYATDDNDKAWADEQSIAYPVLNDSTGVTGKAYNATNTPNMYIVSPDGTLLYQGAIDDARSSNANPGSLNYVGQALTEILAGKTVSVPQTTPYGCTVKYKD
jgi:peroxiredoxin